MDSRFSIHQHVGGSYVFRMREDVVRYHHDVVYKGVCCSKLCCVTAWLEFTRSSQPGCQATQPLQPRVTATSCIRIGIHQALSSIHLGFFNIAQLATQSTAFFFVEQLVAYYNGSWPYW